MLKLCARCGVQVPDDTRTCPNCGPLVEASAETPHAPPSVRRDVRERREVTVLFCDLGGYTEWNEEAEPEDVALTMDRIKQQAVSTFEAHGGVANQFIGDEILGLFGVAASHDDDPSRAVFAALALHAFVRAQVLYRANGELRALRMHSGIETGLVYARVRDPRSGLWEVTGDAINTAARLRSLASEDEILVGPATQRLIAPYFDTVALPPAIVRGKVAPLRAHRVLRAASAPWRFDAARARGLTRYVGRDQPLAHLHAALEQAQAGRGGVVRVVGPAGIGKTRLLYEFRKQVSRRGRVNAPYVAHGRCLGYGEVAPFQPFVEALLGRARGRAAARTRALARIRRLRVVSDEVLSALALLLLPEQTQAKDSLQGDLLRDAIIAALLELLASVAARRPLLLLIEDWQWADEPSRAALRRMAQSARGQRLLIVLNERGGDGADAPEEPASQRIVLQPLDEESTEAVASAALRVQALPDGLVRFVHERAHGNPFFVEEICRSLVDAGALERRGDVLALAKPLSALRAPSTVQAIVRARIDGLSPRHKAILRVGAVIGGEFSLELLARLAGEQPDEAEALLLALEAQGLVFRVSAGPPPSYRFKHAITLEVAYESVPLDERRWLHGQAARLTEQAVDGVALETKCELLAHHYGRSADRDKALEYAVLAGDKAWRAFSLQSADTYYRRALTLLDSARGSDGQSAKSWVDVSVRWARVGLYNPHADQVIALRKAEQLAQQFRDRRGACLCYNWMSWIEYALGNHEQAVATSSAFLEAARGLGDSALLGQALTNLGLSHAIAANYDQAAALICEGIEQRGRFRGTSYAYAIGYLALMAGDRGDFAAASAHLAEATELVGPTARPTLLGPLLVQRTMVAAFRGDWEDCARSASEALEIAQHIDGNYIRAMALTFEGYASFMAVGSDEARAAERLESSLALLQEALALLDARGIYLHASLTSSALAEVLVLAGRHEAARTFAEQSLARARAGDRMGEVMALRALSTAAALGERDLSTARAWKERALAAARSKLSPREEALTRLRWAELLLAHAVRDEAEEELAAISPQLTRLGLASHPLASRRLGA